MKLKFKHQTFQEDAAQRMLNVFDADGWKNFSVIRSFRGRWRGARQDGVTTWTSWTSWPEDVVA